MSAPDWDEARAHAERIRELLRQHAGKREAEEASRAIDAAHEHAHAVLAGDASAPDDFAELAWVKTHLDRDAKPLPRELGTIVNGSGGLFGVRKFEKFDPGWQETLVEYLAHVDRERAPFGNGAVIPHDGDLTLAIAGDWATGYWRGPHTAASKIAALIGPRGEYHPDYAIHLGDTYYAATHSQVREHLGSWPAGKRGRFAVPGNHEMYTKGWHYFDLLEAGKFTQGRTSYFALQTPRWLVLALDTAHYAELMYLEGRLGPEEGNPQREFAARMLAGRGDRRVLLLTHHAPFDLPREKHREIHHDVMQLFRAAQLDRGPECWVFGHTHATARYGDFAAPYRARLVGHGAIPFGPAHALKHNEYVDWYETVSARDSHYPDRVTNGFLQLELRDAECRESLVAEDGSVRWRGIF
jgi:hypothetical protein